MATESLPDLHLWCCFGSSPLRQGVEQVIHYDARLRERVHLIGKVEHTHIQRLMHAADLFVSASHREGSGFALIEALACGLPPVVTDIPSFRALTGDGAIGHLWPTGDAHQFSRALQNASRTISPTQRQSVRAHFDRHLSLPALGRTLSQVYRQLAEQPAWRAT